MRKDVQLECAHVSQLPTCVTNMLDQHQELMKNAISGFGRLPATQRAEARRRTPSTPPVVPALGALTRSLFVKGPAVCC